MSSPNSPRSDETAGPERTKSQQEMLSPNSPASDTAADTSALTLPEWYHRVNKNAKHDRSQVVKLRKIKEAIDKCRANPRADLTNIFDEIRDGIHDAEFREVDAVVIRNTRLLEPELGLPLIFNSSEVDYPFDVKADAQQLWTRWARRVFETDLLRGINTTLKNSSKKGRNTDSLLPNYPGRVMPNRFGNNKLVNGQWWPSQLATLRDGAHGSAQGGIYGKNGEGAYSVVLAGGQHGVAKYPDLDEGDVIWYCGTNGENGQVSDGTKRLLESVNQHPVRVLRSHNLPQDNPYRPEEGYRYDGLYKVVEYEVLDPAKQAHRFHLVRLSNQDPIRSKALGKAERPTAQEKAEYEKIRTLLTSMGEKI